MFPVTAGSSMKRKIAMRLLVVLLTFMLPAGPLQARPVSPVPVITLDGSHYDRGFEHGKVLRSEILDVVENHVLKGIPPASFKLALAALSWMIDVDEGIVQEAKGMVAGAKSAGDGTFRSERFDLDITWKTLLVINAYVDISDAFCSSVSRWRQEDPSDVAIVRNLDWARDPVLMRNTVIFVHRPTEKDEVPFVSVAFAGMVGCLSCMNQDGVAIFLNRGHAGGRKGVFPPQKRFTPYTLLVRKAVEKRFTGVNPTRDRVLILAGAYRIGSFILHIVEGKPSGGEPPAAVMELPVETFRVRGGAENKERTGRYLIATNHLVELDGHQCDTYPKSCKLYQKAMKQMPTLGFGLDALWGVLHKIQIGATLQSILYAPKEGTFWLSVQDPEKLTMSPVFKTTVDTLLKMD